MRRVFDTRTSSPFRSRLGIGAAFSFSAIAFFVASAPALAFPPPSVVSMGRPTASISDVAVAGQVHKVAVFGTDSRKRMPRNLQAMRSSIGLIYNEKTRTVCSAFCVADDVIATASHCVFRTKGETPPPPERFFFARPGTKHASVRFAGAQARSSAQHIVAGTVGISTKPPIDAARDWAFVRLQGPACKGKSLGILQLTPDEVEQEAAAGRVFQVAFHRDFGAWSMAHSGACAAGRRVEGSNGPAPARDFTDPLNLLLHTCDTGGASSGSPLLVETPDGPKVVGINVGTFVRSRVMLEEGVVVRRMPASPVANTAVSAIAFAGRLEPFRQADVLTAVADIRDLQQRLISMNLLDGRTSGRFDEKTRAAIQLYEARFGLPVTGMPTRALLQQLKARAAAALPTRSELQTLMAN